MQPNSTWRERENVSVLTAGDSAQGLVHVLLYADEEGEELEVDVAAVKTKTLRDHKPMCVGTFQATNEQSRC